MNIVFTEPYYATADIYLQKLAIDLRVSVCVIVLGLPHGMNRRTFWKCPWQTPGTFFLAFPKSVFKTISWCMSLFETFPLSCCILGRLDNHRLAEVGILSADCSWRPLGKQRAHGSSRGIAAVLPLDGAVWVWHLGGWAPVKVSSVPCQSETHDCRWVKANWK